MKLPSRSLWVGGLLLLAAALVLWAVRREQVSDEPMQTVRIGYLPIVASLPIFVAAEKQIFQEQGIRAELVPFNDSNTMLNALVAGQIDVLPAVSLVPILHLEVQYPGTVRLFSHSRMRPSNAFDALITREEAQVRSVRDLSGKRIGVFPGTSARNMLKVFLAREGVDTSRVQFVQLPPPAQLASLSSGSIDALFTYEPVTTAAELEGGFRVISGSVYASLLTPNPIGSSVVSRRYERNAPEASARVIKAIDEAVLYMRANPTEAASLLTKWASLPPPIASRVHFVDVTVGEELDMRNLQAFADLLRDVGELQAPIRMDQLAR